MDSVRIAFALLCVLGSPLKLTAQSAHTPETGSEEREALMDTLRPKAQKDLGGLSVIFKVDRLQVAGKWAYVRFTPLHANGDSIDFAKTKYRKQIDLGMFDPAGEALLRLADDGWELLEYSFGSTDVPSAGWSDKYELPKSLLE